MDSKEDILFMLTPESIKMLRMILQTEKFAIRRKLTTSLLFKRFCSNFD